MDTQSTQMYREILNQPLSWARTLQAASAKARTLSETISGADELLFIGCGSSYYLGLAAAGLFQTLTGVSCRACPSGDLSLVPEEILYPGRRQVVVGFSRSGETTETIDALRVARERFRAVTVGITCHRGGPLVELAETALELPWADDESVVMTQSYTNMLLAVQCWAVQHAERPELREELAALPAAARDGLPVWERSARALAEDSSWATALYFGTGAYFGIASEAALKLKETTQLQAEAYQPLEFRHGPLSTVTPKVLAILLGRTRSSQAESALLAEVGAKGAHCLRLGGPEAEVDVTAGAGLGDWARGPLYLPFLQLLAVHKCVSLGLDPDRPRNLSRVVRLAGRPALGEGAKA